MASRRSTPCTLYLVGVLLAGCAAPTTAVRSTSGVFVLRTLDGRPLPTVTQEYPSQRFTLLADTLVLYSDGDYREASLVQVDVTQPPSTTTQMGSSSGTYAYRGDSIDFTIRCPFGALCIQPPLASRSADGITTAYRSTSGLVEVKRYQQVSFPPD